MYYIIALLSLITQAVKDKPLQKASFYYTLTYLPDSTRTNTYAKENFVLLHDDTISYFSSINYLKMGEAFQQFEKNAKNQTQINTRGAKLPLTGFMFRIYHFPLRGVTIQALDMISHAYGIEYPSLHWQISAETQTINDIFTQKAKLYFGGRNYEAWFSPSIPIPEGPYIFKGLPGLIIRISDDKNNYSWELTSISERADATPIHYNPKALDWIKRKDMIYLNTYDGRRSRLASSGVLDSEWQGISKEELIQRAENNLRKNNNQIEIME